MRLCLMSVIFLCVPAVPIEAEEFGDATCEGTYPHHLQGICVGDGAIYWSFTTTLVKTDPKGKVLIKIPVANHHGDLCFHEGRLYVAVNLGKFNDPEGHADSWIYVYDAATLREVGRHPVQEVFYGAGGIGFRDGHFLLWAGYPTVLKRTMSTNTTVSSISSRNISSRVAILILGFRQPLLRTICGGSAVTANLKSYSLRIRSFM